MNGNETCPRVSFQNELGRRFENVTCAFIEELLTDKGSHWGHGSGDCALDRSDGASLVFVNRPTLGILFIYCDDAASYDLAYCPAGSGPVGSVEISVGGQEMMVKRRWLVSTQVGTDLIRRFFNGETFQEGPQWEEYLVNTDDRPV